MHIKLYFEAGNPYCEMLRNMLKFHNIEFETIEISRNKEAKQEMITISGQSNTPVLVVDEKVFVGFDSEKIKEVLGLMKEY